MSLTAPRKPLPEKDKSHATYPPSDKALVPFVSVENMMKLVHHIGIEPMLRGLAEYIEQDFRRWDLFDKTPASQATPPKA